VFRAKWGLVFVEGPLEPSALPSSLVAGLEVGEEAGDLLVGVGECGGGLFCGFVTAEAALKERGVFVVADVLEVRRRC